MISILPKHIHAIWLIFNQEDRQNSSLSKEDIFEILPGISNREYKRLLEAAMSLGLIKDNSWKLTKRGTSFASSPHWRYWTPPKQLKAELARQQLAHCFIDSKQRDKTVVDLFAGVGGLTKGFEEAGFRVTVSVDNDDQACEAHAKNFPESVTLNSDIFSIAENPKKELGKAPNVDLKKVNGVIGGPPCQGFSYIGERVSEDERNLLTSKYVDIVLALKPDFFVMENVPGLLNAGSPPKFSTHIRRLAKSIGEPATMLVEVLPSVPKAVAARDFQYRKRLVSSSVKLAQEGITSKLSNWSDLQLQNVDRIAELTEQVFSSLQQDLFDSIASSYNTDELAQHSISSLGKEKKEIAIIAIASVLSELLTLKVVSDLNCEDFLKSVASKLHHDKHLKQTANYICKKYDLAPKGSIRHGVNMGPILTHILDRLESTYNVSKPTVINAASFGSPQARTRLFIVGVRKDLKKQFLFPEETHSADSVITTSDAIGDLPNIDLFNSLVESDLLPQDELGKTKTEYQKLMRLERLDESDLSLPRLTWNPFLLDCNNRTLHADHVLERLKDLPPGQQDPTSHKSRLHPDKPSHTLRAGTKGNKGSHTAVRPIHYSYDRVISVREGARLMGYPDWMTFHKTKWHGFRLVGNGVCSQVSRVLASEIQSQLYSKN